MRICQQRRYVHKYIHVDISTLTNPANTHCLVVSETISMTSGVPTQSLTSFNAASLSSHTSYLRVWDDQSITVFSPLHCNIASFTLVHPTDHLCHFRNCQRESCLTICWLLSAVNMSEVDNGEFLPARLFCQSEVRHYYVYLTELILCCCHVSWCRSRTDFTKSFNKPT